MELAWCGSYLKQQKRVIHEGPRRRTERNLSLLVFICVHLWFFLKRGRQFLPRMIRRGGGATYLKQKKKELSTKAHEGPRRDTKRDGSAASTRLRPGNPARAPGWASSHDLCRLVTGSKSSVGKFLIHIDAQDAQDFFRRRLASNAGNPQYRSGSSPELASRAGSSRPVNPVHPVHRCSLG